MGGGAADPPLLCTQAAAGTPTSGCSAGHCGIKTVARLLRRQPGCWGRGWHCQAECSRPPSACLPTWGGTQQSGLEGRGHHRAQP